MFKIILILPNLPSVVLDYDLISHVLLTFTHVSQGNTGWRRYQRAMVTSGPKPAMTSSRRTTGKQLRWLSSR